MFTPQDHKQSDTKSITSASLDCSVGARYYHGLEVWTSTNRGSVKNNTLDRNESM